MGNDEGAGTAPEGKVRAQPRGALDSTQARRYRRQAWAAVGGLAAFILRYVLLAGWFVRTAWRLSFGSSAGADGVVGWAVALCAAFIAAFMIKGVFFIRRGKPEGLTELRADEQPRLFKFLHHLAGQAGAPRPYKICVSARVNAAVFYDLSLLNLLLPSRKNLELGLGRDPELRGHVYAAAAVALGPRAPAGWRESASRLLFAAERPYFKTRSNGGNPA